MSPQIIERVSLQENTDFSNPVIRWIDYRLPIFTFLHHELNAYPTPPEGTWLIMSRIGAAYYFAHFFLVLPLLARVPISISQPVLSATGPVAP